MKEHNQPFTPKQPKQKPPKILDHSKSQFRHRDRGVYAGKGSV
jgi:hypothetical protein